ncbi:MAG: cation-translocating P-type ATPase [Bifidobacteriaceae bacterium]|jgi:calcium-translocating P-type ATPase|nr:cation-translocating P-type ATPase [Bifidobacteriaceae bacterium]
MEQTKNDNQIVSNKTINNHVVYNGLSFEAAKNRLQEYGLNQLRPAKSNSRLKIFLQQFRDPLIYLLLAAVIISFFAWALEGAKSVPADVIVIVIILIANAFIGYIQEAKANKAVEALKSMIKPYCRVVRSGKIADIPAADVVPGDVLYLTEGDIVAADGIILESNDLKIAEAVLTGESESVLKEEYPQANEFTVPSKTDSRPLADRIDCVFASTFVTSGKAYILVTKTGMFTQVGKIADMLDSVKEEPSPLTRQLTQMSKILGLGACVIAAGVVVILLLQQGFESLDTFVQMLVLGVSLAVAAVPEGLVAILSVVLALGVSRMAKQHAIVKKLASVETLGAANVICSDKTGTLTQNKMTVKKVSANEKLTIVFGSLCNDTRITEAGELKGDPTETSIVSRAIEENYWREFKDVYKRISEVPFSSKRKMMSVLLKDGQKNTNLLISKGAPDILLDKCSHFLQAGKIVEMNRETKNEILSEITSYSADALRTLGVAYKMAKLLNITDSDETGLCWVGLLGIVDPARPEAKSAIKIAKKAGIRIIMITGDHKLTAGAVAKQIGLIDDQNQVIEGKVLDNMTQEAQKEAILANNVYARVAPEHKLKIVNILKEAGFVTAMTGDGVNDAPAVRRADIGISMGITGTQVTREASKMILTDDNFATIISAVAEGRVIYSNIKKFLIYLLSSNIGEVIAVFLGVLFSSFLGLTKIDGSLIISPLLATQILWINLLTDCAPALALGLDKTPSDLMSLPPRRSGEAILSRSDWATLLIIGFTMGLVTIVAVKIGYQSMAFTVLVLAQLFNVFCCRHKFQTVWKGLFSNKFLLGAVAISFILQLLVIYTPFLQNPFGTHSLSSKEWFIAVLLALVVPVVSEIRKYFLRKSNVNYSFDKS